MLAAITNIIRDKGNAIPGYREAARTARQQATKDIERSVGYFLLGKAAQEFADAYCEEPLHADTAEQQLARLEGFACVLDEAFEAPDLQRRLEALSYVARAMSGDCATATT
ncbi:MULTISPECIES: hypothetical protein [unclassified Mesorhizobium]|jgi:N-carbamoyl-L-amino-acid hydrolase|uniref:hypothetical protein n=1 Tax=unclassified Mesorhizobium TaxID=325217 RepID=UPI0008F07AE2|nr:MULTISPECIES: hypothetical protein [unclassified Mesorhizobium]SFT56558.1 hypothetical protein SAMN05518861_102221 [Mesorhizobium sp. YR577]